MNITQISYGKTINVGNYQSIRVEFTADLTADDDRLSCLEHLKRITANAEEDIKKENGVKR